MDQLLKQKASLEHFSEMERSRTGKTRRVRKHFLSFVFDSYLNNPKQNVVFCPVTNNYDRVQEGESFPLRLMGEEEAGTGFKDTLTGMFYNHDNYGKALIRFCEPISIKTFVDAHCKQAKTTVEELKSNEKAKKQLMKVFCHEMQDVFADNTVVMSSSILASLILGFRKGISEDSLKFWYPFVHKWIEKKGGLVHGNREPKMDQIRMSMRYLSGFVQVKRSMVEPKTDQGEEYKNLLMLSYYRNILVHHFMHESYIIISALSRENGGQSTKDAIK